MCASVEVAIIGAGPYGLSIAAYLQARGVEFRIFGSPMHSWRTRMPAGMFLKSEGFASSLYDPESRFTLKRFCAESGLAYADAGIPIPLETFTAYGLAFQRALVPELDERAIAALDRVPNSFLLRLDDDESITARRVVVAVGAASFRHVPGVLAHLPPEVVSHSSDHHDLSRFRGQDVSVLGGGASALDLAALLLDVAAEARLVASLSALRWTKPLLKRTYLQSGLGGSWRNQLYERAPMLFRRLPPEVRAWLVRTEQPPAGGWPVKDRVERVSLLLGHTLQCAKFSNGRVQLRLMDRDGDERELPTDHVIAATGYRVDLRRLTFLSKEIRSQLRSAGFAPILSSEFQSSVPGLYFVGLASAFCFGPSMRFVLGARYTAGHLARHFARNPSRQ